MASDHDSTPSPHLFVDAVLSYQKTAAIKAAVELDLFGTIGRGASSVEAIAAGTGAAPRGIRILCDYLTVLGFLQKTNSACCQTPSTAMFLDSVSPKNLSSIVRFLAGPELLDLFLGNPAGYVRDGGTRGLGNMTLEDPIWVTFAQTMTPFTVTAAEATAAHVTTWPHAPRKVLDIAAGAGMFGINIANTFPAANIVAVDWPNVVAIATDNARRANLGSRYRSLAGDAFSVDWGEDYDLVLLPNILHHFDHATCVSLLTRVRNSRAPAGRALIIEFIPNEDRIPRRCPRCSPS